MHDLRFSWNVETIFDNIYEYMKFTIVLIKKEKDAKIVDCMCFPTECITAVVLHLK